MEGRVVVAFEAELEFGWWWCGCVWMCSWAFGGWVVEDKGGGGGGVDRVGFLDGGWLPSGPGEVRVWESEWRLQPGPE